MPKFFMRFMGDESEAPWGQKDSIDDIISKLFAKYDTNRNGFLEKTETLRLINEVLTFQRKPLPTRV